MACARGEAQDGGVLSFTATARRRIQYPHAWARQPTRAEEWWHYAAAEGSLRVRNTDLLPVSYRPKPTRKKIKKPRGEGGGRGGEGGRGYNERIFLLGFLVSCGYREESGLVGVRLVK
jgi:hypothetical protein